MSEVPKCRVQADVMQYDGGNQQWIPCAGRGQSNVSLLQSLEAIKNSF